VIRRLAGLVFALAAIALVASSASASGGGLQLTSAGGARFPYRSFVLTLPSNRTLGPSDVHISENGKPVPGLTVTSSSENVQKHFGVVLVIDASRSMTGKPIAGALAAARAFAKHRNAQEPLGVVTFNSSPVARLPLTTDPKAIDAALSNPPPLARQTHIYDAVYGAIAMLHRASADAGSVVVLSDGADTGSRAKARDVQYYARQYGIRVFSVGLRSGAFNPGALRSLASGSLGQYSEASSPQQLAPIYEQLGARIASEYLVTYRSLARPHRHVVVRAQVAGFPGPVSTQYVTPSLRHRPGNAVHTTSFWREPGTMVLIALLCASLVGVAFALVVRPDPRGVRIRMARFVSPPGPEPDDGHPTLTMRALSGAEESLEGVKWWEKLKEDLEIARIAIPAFHLLLWTAVATIGLCAFLILVGAGPLAALGIGVPFGVRAWVSWKLAQQRKLFAEQLADTLQVVASALRAGHSFIAALAMGVDDAPEPTQKEFRRVVVDERLGVPIEDSMRVVSRRMDSPELEQVILVTILQRETGGNTAEVLEHVTSSIRERFELRRTIQTLTAQGRMSRWILTFLPVGLLGALLLINPAYMHPLVATGVGRVLLVVSAAMITAGSLVIKRIIDIKV
jgi:tight adherence protein B